MNSERGRVSETLAVLASPALAVKVLWRRGWAPRLVGPKSFAPSSGAKGRAPQPPTWKRWDSGAGWPRVEVTEPPKAFSAQEVGLRVKPGRSAQTAIERASTGTPCRIVGRGSLRMRPWAVAGSR